MRINLNPTHSVSESPSKPADRVDSDPVFSFFAQIDAIQNSKDNKGGRADTDSRDDDPDKPGGLPLLSALASMAAPDPVPLDPPANPLSLSSGQGEILPNQPFPAAAAYESRLGKSSAALIRTEAETSSDPKTETQATPQLPSMAMPVSLDESLSMLIGPKVEPDIKSVAVGHGVPSSQMLPNGIAQTVRQTAKDSSTAAPEFMDLQNWPEQMSSLSNAQIQQQTKSGASVAAVEDFAGQNGLSQSFSTGLARVLERATEPSGSAAEAVIDGQNPQLSSSGTARTIETSSERAGTAAVAGKDGNNPALQLLSNGIARVLEKNAERSAVPAGKDSIPDPGSKAHSDPKKTSTAQSLEAAPVTAESLAYKLFSKNVTMSAPDQSGHSELPPGKGDEREPGVPGAGNNLPTTQKFNAAAPQNQGGEGSQKDGRSAPNEPGIVAIAQGKANAVQPEIPLAKTETNGNRQDVLSHDLSANVPLVDSTLRPASSSAPETARPPNLIFQIAERIQIQVHDGAGEIRIQLKPDGLGQLEIKAETTANGVIARITTDSDGVKSYLENNLHQLQQTLQDQGLKVDRIYVTVQTGSDHQAGSNHTAQFSQGGQGQQGRGTQNPQFGTRFDEPDMAEEITVDPATWLMIKPNTRFYTVA